MSGTVTAAPVVSIAVDVVVAADAVVAVPAAATVSLFVSAANATDIPLRINNIAKLVHNTFLIESQILSLLQTLLPTFFSHKIF
jgi:hypothetical protein